jgi:hypothetical protein
MVWFSTLNPDGTESNIREITQADMMKCPFCIMTPDHYRLDGTCRCDDVNHDMMAEWGYKWNGTEWTADEHEGDDGC